MALTESDKVVLTKYPIAPSKCVVCLRSANGELNFIDFEMSLDIYGSVNICVECLAPVAQLLGYVEKNLLKEVELQNTSLVEINRELAENNAKLNATIDSLISLRPGLVPSNLSSDAEPGSSEGSNDLDLEFDLDI